MSDKEKEEYFKQKKEEHKLKIKKLMREKNRVDMLDQVTTWKFAILQSTFASILTYHYF